MYVDSQLEELFTLWSPSIEYDWEYEPEKLDGAIRSGLEQMASKSHVRLFQEDLEPLFPASEQFAEHDRAASRNTSGIGVPSPILATQQAREIKRRRDLVSAILNEHSSRK
jgi:hypothetical protein